MLILINSIPRVPILKLNVTFVLKFLMPFSPPSGGRWGRVPGPSRRGGSRAVVACWPERPADPRGHPVRARGLPCPGVQGWGHNSVVHCRHRQLQRHHQGTQNRVHFGERIIIIFNETKLHITIGSLIIYRILYIKLTKNFVRIFINPIRQHRFSGMFNFIVLQICMIWEWTKWAITAM